MLERQPLPLTIMSGYPEKEFKFTGKWVQQSQGFFRAKRNKRIVWVPEYRADDGETILMVKYQYECNKDNPCLKIYHL